MLLLLQYQLHFQVRVATLIRWTSATWSILLQSFELVHCDLKGRKFPIDNVVSPQIFPRWIRTTKLCHNLWQKSRAWFHWVSYELLGTKLCSTCWISKIKIWKLVFCRRDFRSDLHHKVAMDANWLGFVWHLCIMSAVCDLSNAKKKEGTQSMCTSARNPTLLSRFFLGTAATLKWKGCSL